jgi:hypothetical protein
MVVPFCNPVHHHFKQACWAWSHVSRLGIVTPIKNYWLHLAGLEESAGALDQAEQAVPCHPCLIRLWILEVLGGASGR